MTDNQQPQPILEEGIGLRLEEVRNLLAMKHNTIVSADDPILMLVTINNAFLAEYERLFNKHEVALGQYMASETKKHLVAIDELTKTLSTVTVEGLQKASADYLTTLATTKRDLYWLTGLIVVSAIINSVILYLG